MSITSVTSRSDLEAKVRAYLGNLKRASSLTSKTDKARSMVTDITKPQPQLAPPSEYQTNEEMLSDEILQFKKLEKEVVNTVFSTDRDRLKFKQLIRENNIAPVDILKIWNNFTKEMYNDKIPVLTPEELIEDIRRYVLQAYTDPASKEVQEEAENLKTGILTNLSNSISSNMKSSILTKLELLRNMSPTDLKKVEEALEAQASRGDLASLQKEFDALAKGDWELFRRLLTGGSRQPSRRSSLGVMPELEPLYDVKEYKPDSSALDTIAFEEMKGFEMIWRDAAGKPTDRDMSELLESVLMNKIAWAQALSDGRISSQFGLKDDV